MLYKGNLHSLIDCIRKAEDLGYKEKFMVGPRGMITHNNKYVYSPEQTEIKLSYSFDSVTEGRPPFFYMIETVDGKKGYLIDADSIYSDDRIPNFIGKVKNVHGILPVVSQGTSWLGSIKDFLKF